ncbi:hypothetical protein CGMCC3_g17968 [Colletotrichum fructicola]|nr:uncharacterized protein CGMCC3_g17968 [Colletotrichum fructicola]KAE9565853.1 hypothetical protein CGMCC3_g17968 [Colletotrichum fructicola]
MAEPLGIATSVLAVVELSAKIGSRCVECYKAVKNARADIERVRVETDSLQGIANNALKLLEDPP